MKVLIFPTRDAANEKVSELLLNQIKRVPDCVLGLATGGTMEPVYADMCKHGSSTDFSRLRTFNLDEYIGLSPDHDQSYHLYMAQHLFDHLNFDRTKNHLPLGNAIRPREEAQRYELSIRDAGGVDLQLLGVGTNGHIGFNEPGSSLTSKTRIKTLTRSTIEANARFFKRGEQIPQFAITMGIQTIMDAREIIVLATGGAKAKACMQMIEGPISARWPASVLQMHPSATIVLDEDAASALETRDYLETVHPAGKEVLFG